MLLGGFALTVSGGLLGCSSGVPFVLCTICPRPCTFSLVRPWLFGGIVVSSALIGRAFCGLACPVGILSDLLHTSFKGRKWSPPMTRALRNMRYGLTVLTLYLMVEAAGVVLGLLPNVGLWSVLIARRRLISFILAAGLLAFFATSTLAHRFGCKQLCPIGGLLSPTNRFSYLSLERGSEECSLCGSCDAECPQDLAFPSASPDCMRCMACYTSCSGNGISITRRPSREKPD
jgi:polyferredoxin